jgi:hypothetical protein
MKRFSWFGFKKKEQVLPGRFVGRRFTCDDTAIKFRMGAGFPGSITRVERAVVEANLPDATTPPLQYGYALILNASGGGVRQMTAGDTGTIAAFGVLVRDYPVQGAPSSAFGSPSTLGSATPPTTQTLSVMRSGYILVKVNGTTQKGGTAFVWTAASSAPHVQGQWEATTPGGSGCTVSNATFNGVPDANGFVELAFNL